MCQQQATSVLGHYSRSLKAPAAHRVASIPDPPKERKTEVELVPQMKWPRDVSNPQQRHLHPKRSWRRHCWRGKRSLLFRNWHKENIWGWLRRYRPWYWRMIHSGGHREAWVVCREASTALGPPTWMDRSTYTVVGRRLRGFTLSELDCVMLCVNKLAHITSCMCEKSLAFGQRYVWAAAQ